MQRKAVGSGFQQSACTALAVAAGKTYIQLAGCAAFAVKQRCFWDAVVNDIDHSTDGAAAVLQRAWPAQHFDAFNADRVSSD